MIILDTNVLSELLRPSPAPAVLDWMGKYPFAQLFTTAITQSEMLYGVALLPRGKRRTALAAAVESIFVEVFGERVLPFDSPAARAYAEIASAARARGRPMSQLDAQIGAIALTHGAAVATRNSQDFERCGVKVVNPWSEI